MLRNHLWNIRENSIRAHWSIRFVPRTLFKTVDSKQILMKQKLVVTCTLANWFLPSDFCPRYRSYFVRFSNWHSSMDLAAILWWTCVNHRVVNDAGMIQRQDVCDDDLAVFWFLLSPKTCKHINNKPERKKTEKRRNSIKIVFKSLPHRFSFIQIDIDQWWRIRHKNHSIEHIECEEHQNLNF